MPATSTPPRRIVIIGGGYAGLTIANRLARLGAPITITLIDAKNEFHERIRLHQAATGQKLRLFGYADFLTPLGVKFIRAQVTGLDPNAALLSLRHPDGNSTQQSYDYLVYALGSHIDRSRVAGAEAFTHTLDSPQAARAIHAQLARRPDSRVLVVGGGLTGIEMATELAESFPHARVTLATATELQPEAVPGGFSHKAVSYLQQTFQRLDIALQQGSRVAQLQAGVANMSDGRELPFDSCIWTSGFAAPGLAAAAGIRVNAQGQIVTDAALRSLSHPNIIAIGDAAQADTPDSGLCRMGCATGLAMAASGARTIAALLAGQTPPAFRFVYLFRNLCLGRQDGLIQFVDRRDVPRNIIWTGAAAARWKDYICRSTLSTIGLSAEEKLPAMPPLRMLPQLMRVSSQYA